MTSDNHKTPIIDQKLYQRYFDSLLKGDRQTTTQMVTDLLNKQIDIRQLYTDLFEKSLYQIGTMWECNKISVAKEHLVTAITENLLNLVYPFLFSKHTTSQKVIISCAANEFHQIGGKMVADIFELEGWDSCFLGANTPVDEIISFIDEFKPDLVGLSLSIYFNFSTLKQGIDRINTDFPGLDIIVGGQAFQWGAGDALKQFKNVQYLKSLDELDSFLNNN